MKKEKISEIEKYELCDFVTDDGVFKTMLTDKFKARKPYKPVNPKQISTKIPGTVKNIFVQKGQTVSRGDVLLELEAMKMVNNILSPEDGIVKDIFVKINENIASEFVMMEIE